MQNKRVRDPSSKGYYFCPFADVKWILTLLPIQCHVLKRRRTMQFSMWEMGQELHGLDRRQMEDVGTCIRNMLNMNVFIWREPKYLNKECSSLSCAYFIKIPSAHFCLQPVMSSSFPLEDPRMWRIYSNTHHFVLDKKNSR